VIISVAQDGEKEKGKQQSVLKGKGKGTKGEKGKRKLEESEEWWSKATISRLRSNERQSTMQLFSNLNYVAIIYLERA
jgi:hypothetical protein